MTMNYAKGMPSYTITFTGTDGYEMTVDIRSFSSNVVSRSNIDAAMQAFLDVISQVHALTATKTVQAVGHDTSFAYPPAP